MSDLTVDGMALAPGVVETIVSIAVADVDGVASVGNAPAASRGIRGVLGGKPSTSGITCCPTWRLRSASPWRTPWLAR